MPGEAGSTNWPNADTFQAPSNSVDVPLGEDGDVTRTHDKNHADMGAAWEAMRTDARWTNGRAPSGPAGGDLAGTYPNPTLAINRATALSPTAVKTANYTAAANEFVPVDTTSGAVTITLPTAPADGTRVGVKLVIQGGTNAVTIARGGSDVFNKAGGSTSLTLSLLFQAVSLQYKASSGIWYVVGDDLPLGDLDARFISSAAGSVTSTNIADGTIVNADISASAAIAYSKLALTGSITDTDVAAANKDGAAGTASMRTLGTGAAQAAAGNDSRLLLGSATQVNATNTTWPIPSGATILRITAVGGGGQGGGGGSAATAAINAGGSGGGAGAAVQQVVAVGPNTTLNVTIGAGGSAAGGGGAAGGNAGTAGSNGGNTTVTGTGIAVTATGGGGGGPGGASSTSSPAMGNYGFAGATSSAGPPIPGMGGRAGLIANLNAGGTGFGFAGSGGGPGGPATTSLGGTGGSAGAQGVGGALGTSGGSGTAAGTAGAAAAANSGSGGGGGGGGTAGTGAGGSGGTGGSGFVIIEVVG